MTEVIKNKNAEKQVSNLGNALKSIAFWEVRHAGTRNRPALQDCCPCQG